ncbi:hypothetical protein [Flavobacterium sp.]|uniref:hypothetical protein n=1 Tax=Flavobacterium sp. TaxID=239 RepID=UPI0037517B96
MTIAKRKKGASHKQTDKKVRKLHNSYSSFPKYAFKNREIEIEDEAIVNPLIIHNILE